MSRRTTQAGSTIVEFAMGLLLFLTFLLGVTDFARMLYTWNAVTEATRAGARYAVVCDNLTSQDDVLRRLQGLVPQIAAIELQWFSASGGNCASTSDCLGVELRVVDLQYDWISPIAGMASALSMPMPPFRTVLTREAMRQDPNSPAICAAWPRSPE